MLASDFNRSVVNASTGNGTGSGNNPFAPTEEFLSAAANVRIVSICCYVGIFILSAIGNTAIIGIVLGNKHMQTKANVLIMNMVISDLVATIFTVPRMIDVEVSNSYRWKVPGVVAEVVCKFNVFIREVSCAVSIFSLVAIALDRFYAIVVPLANKPTVMKLKYLIPIIWGTSMGANALYLYAFQIKIVNHEGKDIITCFNILNNHQEKIYDTLRFVIFIAAPLLLLVFLYISISIKMTAQNIPGANVEAFAKSRRKQNRNIVTLSIIIVASFAVCWVPYYIGLLLNAFHWQSQDVPFDLIIPIYILDKTFTILSYASFAVNPYICLIFSSNFRRNARRTFCRQKPSGRAMTRITTTTNPNVPRALSMSNLEISLENLGANTTIRRENRQDSETPSEIDMQTKIHGREGRVSQASGDLDTSRPEEAVAQCSGIEDSSGTTQHPSLGDEYSGYRKPIASPEEMHESPASLNELDHSMNQHRVTYINQAFENHEM